MKTNAETNRGCKIEAAAEAEAEIEAEAEAVSFQGPNTSL